jgi:hypothetical protein
VLDSLPPDVRAVTEADIQQVQEEARTLVRAQALARAQRVNLSARSVSDIAHVNRVEGLALGEGASKAFGSGVTGRVRARYGIDDHAFKASGTLGWIRPSGFGVRLFALNDFRDVSDDAERSSAVNSLASQEFGSDYSDPYGVHGAGIGFDVPLISGVHSQVDASVERQDSLRVHARPVVGSFMPTVAAAGRKLARVSLLADRAPALWLGGMELTLRGELRGTWDLRSTAFAPGGVKRANTMRGFAVAEIERPYGVRRLVSRTSIGGLWTSTVDPEQELFYVGGTVTAPGYDYHSLIGRAVVTQHVEWQIPVPFPAFSLGRFGRVPASGVFAPFVHGAFVGAPTCDGTVSVPGVSAPSLGNGASRPVSARSCPASPTTAYPSVGVALLSPFNLVRIDVARGLRREGRWTFGVDLSREFWSIF